VPLSRKIKLTVNIPALVVGAVNAIHLGTSAAYASRDPEAISSSIVMVEGSGTSAAADTTAQPGIGIKAVPVLLITKSIIDVIGWVDNVLLLRSC